MKSDKAHRLFTRAAARLRAFTLVEVLVAMSLAVLVLGAVASIIVMAARLSYKNQRISDAVTTTRQVQEHLNEQISTAISQSEPVTIKPVFGGDTSGTSPLRYSEMVYRVPIGSFATVYSDTARANDEITAIFPADMDPKVGDFLLMDTPDLGTGIKIVGRNPASGSGTVTIELEMSIEAGTRPGTELADAEAGSLIRIQRERKYEVVPPVAGARVTELRWYETTEPDAITGVAAHRVLSKNLDANARYMFAEVVDAGSGDEAAVSWQFSFATTDVGANVPGSNPDFYQTAYAEGLIMPKSGNPLNAASIIATGSTTSSTTSTTTSSSTTSSTTSSSTTSSSSSTTSTTSSKTTTSKTTSKSTTSTTTSKTSSTTSTSKSTTSTTSKSTTSTTSKSTTKTTSKSTTSTSTSKTTSKSTTSTSTSSTTSKSTTSTSTSKTTTSSTTSMSTSSTTTSKSTTSSTTSKSTSSTTSKSTTTSIPFDG